MEDIVYNYLNNEHFIGIFLTVEDYNKLKLREPIKELLAVDDVIYFYRYLTSIYNELYYYVLIYPLTTLKDIGFVEDYENKNDNVVIYKHYNITLPPATLMLDRNVLENYKYG